MLAKAFLGLAFLLGVLAAALFGLAGTTQYWQGWVFLAVFGGASLAITIDLAVRDPALLARRVAAAEPRPFQKVVQGLASLAFIAAFVVAGLDRRYGWSAVPAGVVIGGDALVALGLAAVGLVFRANTYTAATVRVERDQRVVSTGPYGVVRHPMYTGAFVMMLGVPFALASWWALPAVAALYAVIVIRLVDEEQLLACELTGYAEYRRNVRYRLVPFVW